MIKNHENNEYWTYGKKSTVLYHIDGKLRTFAMSCQYLMDKYNMSISESGKYVSEITNHK